MALHVAVGPACQSLKRNTDERERASRSQNFSISGRRGQDRAGARAPGHVRVLTPGLERIKIARC